MLTKFFFKWRRPKKKIKSLSNLDINNIIKFTKKTLIKAIRLGGSSIKIFLVAVEKKAHFSNILVFTVKKDIIAQRQTVMAR